MKNLVVFCIIAVLPFFSCIKNKNKEDTHINPDKYLEYSAVQLKKTLKVYQDSSVIPRSIEHGNKNWSGTKITSWTSGFFPGLLWYMFEFTNDDYWKNKAHEWTVKLDSLRNWENKNHDLGFMVFCSYGNAYRLTKDEMYKEMVMVASDSLASLFNPNVGTILSWPFAVEKMGWTHNTIIDNMMNLEMLFWASEHGGQKEWYNMAVRHANTTMKNHIRDDHSTYHVLVYDSIRGTVDSALTWQGYADGSMWARGQAWGIYGFTVAYRETGIDDFLETAKALAGIYISRLPDDYVPYWDFDAPGIPNEEKDASAAAVAASALLELSTLVLDAQERKYYREMANKMLKSLAKNFLAKDDNNAILLHSVGSKPHDSEVDVPIIYADYYFVEALLKEKNIQEKEQNQE